MFFIYISLLLLIILSEGEDMRLSWILFVLVNIMSTQDLIALFSELDPTNYGKISKSHTFVFHT